MFSDRRKEACRLQITRRGGWGAVEAGHIVQGQAHLWGLRSQTPPQLFNFLMGTLLVALGSSCQQNRRGETSQAKSVPVCRPQRHGPVD